MRYQGNRASTPYKKYLLFGTGLLLFISFFILNGKSNEPAPIEDPPFANSNMNQSPAESSKPTTISPETIRNNIFGIDIDKVSELRKKQESLFVQEPITRTTQIEMPSNELAEYWLTQFAEFQKKILGDLAKNVGDPRIVVFEASDTWGWGNHILGLTSAILWAIATDRAIMINDPYLLEKVFDWPFEYQFTPVAFTDKMRDLELLKWIDDDCFYTNKGIGQTLQEKDWNTMSSSSRHKFYSNCPAFHWMGANPIYTQKLKKLGLIPDRDDIPKEHFGFYAASAINKIFISKLKLNFVRDANQMVTELKADNGFVICAQMRLGGAQTQSPEFLTHGDVEELWNCLADLARGKPNVKYYISTDSPGMQGLAKHILGDNTYWIKGEIAHTGGTPQMAWIEKAVSDNFVIGECDEIIITPQSTYGAVAVLRTGKVPLYILDNQCRMSSPVSGPGGRLPNSIIW